MELYQTKQRRSNVRGTVYLLHFHEKFHHCQHYVGWTEGDVAKRLDKHWKGAGAKLLKAVVGAGIEICLVRVWKNQDRHFERRLKNRKNSKQLCPLCK